MITAKEALEDMVQYFDDLLEDCDSPGTRQTYQQQRRIAAEGLASLDQGQILLDKDFPGFETYLDMMRNMDELFYDTDIPGVYQGTLHVKVTYKDK